MHLSLPKRFPLFILASVYWFPQCLISALTQQGSGGHFFRLTCSVMLWGGRNTANKYHWHVWGVLCYGPHWVCPSSWRHVLSWSTLLRLCRRTVQSRPCISYTSQVLDAQVQVLRYSTKAQTWLGVRFVPFPGPSSSGDQVLGEHTVPGGLCILITSPVPAAWFPRCARRAPSQVCHVSPLGS